MNDENNFPFEINYDLIMQSDMMSCTHDCVRMVRKNEYLTVGEYMTSLTSSQLEEMLEAADDEENVKFEEFLLIAEILARAEGLEGSEDFDVLHRRLNILIGLIAVEGLSRKGMIRAYPQNFSFGEDTNKKIIAEKL